MNRTDVTDAMVDLHAAHQRLERLLAEVLAPHGLELLRLGWGGEHGRVVLHVDAAGFTRIIAGERAGTPAAARTASGPPLEVVCAAGEVEDDPTYRALAVRLAEGEEATLENFFARCDPALCVRDGEGGPWAPAIQGGELAVVVARTAAGDVLMAARHSDRRAPGEAPWPEEALWQTRELLGAKLGEWGIELGDSFDRAAEALRPLLWIEADVLFPSFPGEV